MHLRECWAKVTSNLVQNVAIIYGHLLPFKICVLINLLSKECKNLIILSRKIHSGFKKLDKNLSLQSDCDWCVCQFLHRKIVYVSKCFVRAKIGNDTKLAKIQKHLQ